MYNVCSSAKNNAVIGMQNLMKSVNGELGHNAFWRKSKQVILNN